MPSNVLVSSLSVTNANGLYVRNAQEKEKAIYFLNGTNFGNSQANIYWNGERWSIEEQENGPLFESDQDQDVEFPWLVTNWTNIGPESDPPTVTEVPVSSQNTFGLPTDVVALITSRFGTVANYLRLRNQGQI